MDLDKYFVKSELIPAVIQEHGTNEVLMLAYMNKESLAKTLETGYTWFFSRSRQKLWNKGETSGHKQKIVSIMVGNASASISAILKPAVRGVAAVNSPVMSFAKKL